MDWDQKSLEELAQFIVKYDLTEMEIQNGDERILLKRAPAAIQMARENQTIAYPVPEVHPRWNTDFRRITEKKAQQDELKTAKTVDRSETVIKPAAIPESGDAKKYVLSPLAGIFYRQSQPGNPPYVEIGQRVQKGDVICLVEAMKMINEISANRDGVVKEFLVENEQFVEYGSPLVLIEEE